MLACRTHLIGLVSSLQHVLVYLNITLCTQTIEEESILSGCLLSCGLVSKPGKRRLCRPSSCLPSPNAQPPHHSFPFPLPLSHFRSRHSSPISFSLMEEGSTYRERKRGLNTRMYEVGGDSDDEPDSRRRHPPSQSTRKKLTQAQQSAAIQAGKVARTVALASACTTPDRIWFQN